MDVQINRASESLLWRPTQVLTRYFVLPEESESKALPLPEADPVRRFRGMRMGDIEVLLDSQYSMELLDRPAIFPLPHAVECCLGLINLRNRLMPVFDFRPWLRAEDSEDSTVRYVLAVGGAEAAAALVIDAIPVSVEATMQQALKTLPPLPERIVAHVRACYRLSDVFYFELDHMSLLQQQATETQS